MVERTYSVTPGSPSVSVRVQDGVSNLRLSFSGVSNLFFQAGHPCPLDIVLYFFFLFLQINICCRHSLEAPRRVLTPYVFIYFGLNIFWF